MNLGRDKVGWDDQLWHRIDEAVHDEAVRTEIASKFIPVRGPFPDALTVSSDIVDPNILAIDEGKTTPLLELWVEFRLTAQQVASEEHLGTAVSLATRASNILSRAEDLLIFQGDAATRNELFKKVRQRGGPIGAGLIIAAGNHAIDVPPTDKKQKRFGEHTFAAVAQACSRLQQIGHGGPYALVLHSDLYADSYAPLANTLMMPADRIRPLVAQGYFASGALPDLTGIVVSLGGNTIDLAVGVNATTSFSNLDDDGYYRFRVFERIALRVKDSTAIVRLRFNGGEG